MLHTLAVQGRHSEPTEEVSLPQLRTSCEFSPLMELPPLSPGIQARVMEEVEVVETVSRGWSGGTEEETPGVNKSMILPCKLSASSSLCGGSSYLEPEGWRWWCQSRACWWPCRCSSQSPPLWPSAAPEYRWTEWVAARLEILEWLYPHWQTIKTQTFYVKWNPTKKKKSQKAKSQLISQLNCEWIFTCLWSILWWAWVPLLSRREVAPPSSKAWWRCLRMRGS